MNVLKGGFLGTGIVGICGTLTVGGIIERSMINCDIDIQKPIDTVSIIMASYNEEALIEVSTSSAQNQSIIAKYPEYFEFILVDGGSQDRTVEFAEPFVDKIIIAPRGKLTARKIATSYAKGNIIVSADSDTYYPYHWLNTLLKPFSEPNLNVTGINGSTFDYGIPKVPGMAYTIGSFLERTILRPRQMVGRNSAYYKHNYYLSGGFNDNINQFNLEDILNEEEIAFGDRLSKFGKIMFKVNAYCIHFGGRKIGCRLGLYDKDYCDAIGIGKDRF